jgi:putative ABC transport system permease protein
MATGLAIFISCLVYWGWYLYNYSAYKRDRCKKVLGASVSQIVTLISKDFLGLIMLALPWPSPFHGLECINGWKLCVSHRNQLVDLRYCRISNDTIALITLGFQTIKAAIANPVESLRTE